ncbi:MAG: glycoside hydrolase family 28 protein [Puniceicoccaceae bacterium]
MRVLVILIVNALLCVSGIAKEYDVREFGALADGTTVNTQAIQAAIDACHEGGGGRVRIEGGTYLSGTILLKDNVILHVEEGAKLMSSRNPTDFVSIDPFIDATGQYRGQCLVGAMDVKNIGITGKGTIDGQGVLFTPANIKKTLKELGLDPEMYSKPMAVSDLPYVNKNIRKSNRPFLVRLVRAKNVIVKDITLRQPAAWTLHFYQCSNFVVDGVTIRSHANKNNDGIDIDSSTDGVIQNCDIDSDDDAVCFKATSPKPTRNIVVQNCRLSSGWGAVKFGTESMGDFRDIVVQDCHIHNTRGGGIKLLSVDGANASNIVLQNLTMENVDMPLFMRLGERRLVYRDAGQQPVGSIRNVVIQNIKATARSLEQSRVVPPAGIFITGTPNHKIENVLLENIHITLPGGGTEADAQVVVPENETEYPEYTKLGQVPAYGMFARHVRGLTTKSVTFETTAPDARPEVVKVDVE